MPKIRSINNLHHKIEQPDTDLQSYDLNEPVLPFEHVETKNNWNKVEVINQAKNT